MTKLLAPAGNWDCARAAVANDGCHFLWFGTIQCPDAGGQFQEGLFAEINGVFASSRGKRICGIQYADFPRELGRAVEQIEIMAQAGVDAAIVQHLVRHSCALERLGVTKGTLERRRGEV